MENDDFLVTINGKKDLDFNEHYNRVYRDYELNDDPYFGLNIEGIYNTVSSVANSIKDPIFLSINIQSLISKHEQLIQFLHDLSEAKIIVDVIAVQEIWDV
jgi:hypothetical protein